MRAEIVGRMRRCVLRIDMGSGRLVKRWSGEERVPSAKVDEHCKSLKERDVVPVDLALRAVDREICVRQNQVRRPTHFGLKRVTYGGR